MRLSIRSVRTILGVASAAVLLTTPGLAYYHFVHYTSSTAPYEPIVEKFDLGALPNKTLTFVVSDAGPTQFAGNDSFASVLGQIRQAIQVWNSVGTSDLRVVFGGLYTEGLAQSAPGADIEFVDDLGPGVLAMGGPTSRTDVASGPDGPFVPIVRATVRINQDLTQRPGPSYTEAFFTTLVHEMGHALGLQHTFTSSAMSTAISRATSRAKPLGPDDMAGISLLYPTADFATRFGSIAGRVTTDGQGVHLASVVALRPNGSAISTLTNPDGTYRIDGLPPDTYWVYVHPLPPASQTGLGPGDIVLPLDPDGTPVAASEPFRLLFYPGTRDPLQFSPIKVTSGSETSGIDFQVQSRPDVPIYDVSTYSYFGQNGVRPAYLDTVTPAATIVARGPGITSGDAAAPGLGVQVLGGFAPIPPSGIRPYGAPDTNLAIDLTIPLFAGVGPHHLYFTLPDDAYVLPNGLNLTQAQPPSVTSVTPNPDGTVSIAGSNLTSGSRFFFDGLPATVLSFSGDTASATAVVTPPTGFSDQQAAVTVFNSDGQNSMFVQSQEPPTYTYPPAAQPTVSVTPASLPAGVSAMVDILGVNTNFENGQTAVGFGSDDVAVRSVYVLSPTHAVANVMISPNAPSVATELSVITGFQVAVQPAAFQILPYNPQLTAISLPPLNALTGQPTIFAGAYASLYGSNLSTLPDGAGVTITIGDQPAPILYASPNQINFQVPASLSVGPTIMRLFNGTDNAFPIVVSIDPPPPQILAVISGAGVNVDEANPGVAGNLVTILVQNLDPATVTAMNRVHLDEGGSVRNATSITPVPDQPNVYQVTFALSPSVSGPQVSFAVTQDGISGNPVHLPILEP